MGRLLKVFLVFVAGVVGVIVIAAVSFVLFFDPNDFRDRISAAVKESTGRDLVVGEIEVSVFPWLAVEVGRTELGNAEGFDDGQFLVFDHASLSVRILPLIIRQQVEVGKATLDGLAVNLAVARDGTTNWDDLADGGDAPAPDETRATRQAEFDIGAISVTGATVSYSDASAGSAYSISDLSLETGRIALDTPIDIRAGFDFEARPDDIGGRVDVRGTATLGDGGKTLGVEGLNVASVVRGVFDAPAEINFDSRSLVVDTAAQTMDLGEMDLVALGVSIAADVEPFSYAGTPQPVAEVRVAEFSLKELMATLGIEPPATADPDALTRISFSARAAVGENDIALSAVSLDFDDSAMTGELSLPMSAAGRIGFDLEVDSIVVDGYMAPVDESAPGADEAAGDVEIPADLVRTLDVDGAFRIRRALLAGMEFTDLEVVAKAAGGKLRLNPLGAKFYDGSYAGDVQVDASRDVPFLSVNERIEDVNLGSMMKAMYEVDNITGTIDGHFRLQGAGKTLSAIRQDLDGTLSFSLADGAWEGTDVWHQLRTARALYRRENPPAPRQPARTEFTSVTATGTVNDGIFSNNDFLAELPFLRLSGGGIVDLVSHEVDYSLEVRVLERPEFMAGATAEELADFTETVVPLKITGSLAAPSVRPDIEGIFRSQVEEALEEKKQELKDRLINRLLGPDKPPEEGAAGEGAAVDGAPDAQAEEPPEEDVEEQLKNELLKKLFEN